MQYNSESRPGSAADPEGAQEAPLHPPPPQKDRLCFVFVISFCIRMLENKAQIARESIKDPYKGASGFAFVMCVRAHYLLRPPPPHSDENPGSTPEDDSLLCHVSHVL